MTTTTATPHPAKFSPYLLVPLLEMLEDAADGIAGADHARYADLELLDPFAGVGTIHDLADQIGIRSTGVELEKEWADQHPRTYVGDATRLPFPRHSFDIVATSPPYGNRMADSYDGRDGSRRHTYRIDLGRPLTPDSAAGLQWGNDYRSTMAAAWNEAYRVLRPGGRLVLNIADHVRSGQRQFVPEWHSSALEVIGFEFLELVDVPRPSGSFANAQRVGGERLYHFLRP